MIPYFVISVLCNGVASVNFGDIDLVQQNKITEGENRYNELVKKSYGNCWQEALSHLHLGCKHLTEEIQSRLALSFTNCFLEYSGSKTCPCPDETPIKVCLTNSSDRIFSTYTEFFTHTQSICHYLQHREWQKETQRTVAMLNENSEIVSKKLDKSSKAQSKILDMQQVALLEQKQLISNGRTLSMELQRSRDQARNVFDEFKSSTNEQKFLIFEVFDRIKSLQHFVLGEFTSVYTFAYYVTGVILVYVATSVPRTANARIWLLLLISGNFVLERFLVSLSLDEEMLKLFPLDINGPMYSKIWIWRKCICAIGFIILVHFYHCYRDYNTINNQLLREIQRQNSELQEALKSIKSQQLPEKNSTRETTVLGSNMNYKYPLDQSFTPISSPINEVKMYNSAAHDSGAIGKFSNSSKRSKKTVEKTPVKTKKKSTKEISTTPKEIAILSSKENVAEVGSPQRRYNLRSRVNSPAQSPYASKPSPLKPQELVDAVTLHLENKVAFSNII